MRPTRINQVRAEATSGGPDLRECPSDLNSSRSACRRSRARATWSGVRSVRAEKRSSNAGPRLFELRLMRLAIETPRPCIPRDNRGVSSASTIISTSAPLTAKCVTRKPLFLWHLRNACSTCRKSFLPRKLLTSLCMRQTARTGIGLEMDDRPWCETRLPDPCAARWRRNDC